MAVKPLQKCFLVAAVFLGLLACRPFAKGSVNGVEFAAILPYITSYQNTYTDILDDETVGPPIFIPSGLPFGNTVQYKAYVSPNGLISFSKPFHFYQPGLFPSSNPEIRHSHVLAPFANDIDIAANGSISIGVHNIYNSPSGTDSYNQLDTVNGYIHDNLALNHPDFKGLWMMVVTWNTTTMYPFSAAYGTYEYRFFSSETQTRLEQTNTFQAVVITDYITSYAIFNYRCGDLNSPGWQYFSEIGVNADNAFVRNHFSSGYPSVSDIACSTPSEDFTNLAYRLNMNANGIVDPSDDQSKIGNCWKMYENDLNGPTVSQNSINQLPRCPCSEQQMMRDFQFYVDPEDDRCYISRFPEQSSGLARSCCYRRLTDSASSRPYVSYFRHHPRLAADSTNSQIELQFRSACCDDKPSLGMCGLYYGRRAPNYHVTCTDRSYNPRFLAFSAGSHHFTTFDGYIYTFNGVSEYSLVEHPRLQVQGRMVDADPLAPGTSKFSAIVIRYDTDYVQVEVNNSLLRVEHEESQSGFTDYITTFYNPTLDIDHSNPNITTIVFNNGPALEVTLSDRGYLDFKLSLNTQDLQVTGASFTAPTGLLGNLNGNANDDLVARTGETFPSNTVDDEQINYSFGPSWELGPDLSDSIFNYRLPYENFDFYTFPDFAPELLSEFLSIASQSVIAACANNPLCIFDAHTSGSVDVGLEVLLMYKEIDATITDSPPLFQPAITQQLPSEFDIDVRQDIQRCLPLNVVDNETPQGGLLTTVASQYGFNTYTSLVNIDNSGSNNAICFTFDSSDLPKVTEISSPTYFLVDSSSNVVSYTPFANVCRCGTQGLCHRPTDTEYWPRVDYVLIEDCQCDRLPDEFMLLFPYGSEAGDTFLPRGDDVNSPVIAIDFPFYGANETGLSVNSNGVIHFRFHDHFYGPVSLPYQNSPLIAPFWHDIDITRGGRISYRPTNESNTLARARAFLEDYYSDEDPDSPQTLNFFPTSVFVSTWDNVSPFLGLYYGNNSNTFQMLLITDGSVSYVLILYKEINWGVDTTIAFQPSLHELDPSYIFRHPLSGTAETRDIGHFSNVERKGVFVYRVDGTNITEPSMPRASSEPMLESYGGPTCEADLNGCQLTTCFNGSACEDNPIPYSGVICPGCPTGFLTWGEKCYDMDECEEGTHNCDLVTGRCINTIGSFYCGCKEGLTLTDDLHSCVPLTDCSTPNICGPMQGCELVTTGGFGSLECTCPQGYTRRERDCIITNNCIGASENMCPPTQRCIQRGLIHTNCVCPPFTLHYGENYGQPQCIVYPASFEGTNNSLSVQVEGMSIQKFIYEGYIDAFIYSTYTEASVYCGIGNCSLDFLVPISAPPTTEPPSEAGTPALIAPGTQSNPTPTTEDEIIDITICTTCTGGEGGEEGRRRKRQVDSLFDDIKVVIDYDNLNLTQSGTEFTFDFYIEVTISGQVYVFTEPLTMGLIQFINEQGLNFDLPTSTTVNVIGGVTTAPTTTMMPTTTSAPTTEALVVCAAENDPVWWLPFPLTSAGEDVRRECPQNGTSRIIGVASRFCTEFGMWEEVDTSNCTREEFQMIEETAEEIFAENITDIDPVQVEMIIEQLIMATDTNTTGGSTNFANDLNTTNTIVNSAVNYLLESVEVADTNAHPLDFNAEVIDVLNNVLAEVNMEGWEELEGQEDAAGSQQLLLNAEAYGQYVATALMSDVVETGNETDKTLQRDNIELSAKIIDPVKVEDILFPEVVQTSDEVGSAQTIIPAALLEERGAREGNVSAVNILFSNLELFLPNNNLESNTTRPVTQVISTQLLSDKPVTKFETLASFRFTTQKFSDDVVATNPRCASFNISGNIKESKWTTDGVTTGNIDEDKENGVFIVDCTSNHFTAFSVLMDVTGALNDTSAEIQFALSVVTYVGCSISIFFLLISIVYLCTLWKELFTKVHYFVHLNLAIALLFGYIVFLAGIDTAVINRGLCVFVAALLHYLFTAVFFWMLCEGIMLYLMLVVVFTEISKKWWLFFLLGWGVPVIPVVISVGVINDQYGTENYCWIAVGNASRGAIWAFVVPMLVVILLNIFFLLAALRSVYIQRKLKMEGKGKKKNLMLFKQLFMATIILLPLLGLTWVFGLLSVGDGAIVFAWLFTIFNSLQGLFIFIFHVLRSEKVWNAITKSCSKKDDVTSSTSGKKSHAHNRDSVLSGTQLTSTGSLKGTLTRDPTGFQNSTFENAIDEVTPEADEDTNPDLLEVDETMFEPESESDGEYNADSDNDDKWLHTVTFNWLSKGVSRDDLDDDAQLL